MCELYSRWAVKEDFTREPRNDTSHNSGLKEEVGDSIDQFDKCPHFAISRLANGHFYCHRCQIELELTQIKIKN